MSSYTDSAIYKVINLEDYYRKKPPSDEQTLARWNSDTYARMTERYQVFELNKNHHDLLRKALKEWNEDRSVSFYLRKYFGGHEYFNQWFKILRQTMIDRATIPPPFSKDDYSGGRHPIYPPTSLVANTVDKGFREDESYLYRIALEHARKLVGHIAWCECFGVLLPQAVTDTGLRKMAVEAGTTMSAVFYLEIISKRLDDLRWKPEERFSKFDLKDDDFEKIDAYWRLAMKFRDQS